MLANAEHLLEQLRSRFPQLGATRANALSNTVYFRCPSAELVKKYSLATMHLERDGKSELYSHVVVMPHVSRDVLTEFLDDVPKA